MSRISALVGIRSAGLLQALRLAFAAWLAFSIATFLEIPHAYWAAMPIWVVTQPTKGMLLERAIYRFVGSLLGAGVGLLLLKVSPEAYVTLLLLGVWVAVAAALVHVLRGVQSYAALLAGMTAGVVILPSVLSPNGSFEIALSRVACTLIGVVVVTLVMAVSTPWARREEFYTGVRQLAAETIALAAARLAGRSGHEVDLARKSVLAGWAQATGNAPTMTAGTLVGYQRFQAVNALAVASFAVLATADQMAVRAAHSASPVPGADRLAALADALAKARAGEADLELAALGAEMPGLIAPLERVVTASADLALRAEEMPARPQPVGAFFVSPYRDWRVARESALIAGGSTLVASVVGLWSGWPSAGLASLGVCIFAMIMTTLPAARTAAPSMLLGVTMGVVVAILYRFLIQPGITTSWELSLSLVPFVLAGALARVSQRSGMPALDANMCFLLASQPVLPVVWNPPAILTDSLALIVGAGLVTALFRALPNRTDQAAAYARDAIRHDLERLLTADFEVHADTVPLQRQLLRLSLRILRAGGYPDLDPQQLVAARKLGDALAALRVLAASGEAELSKAAERAVSAAAFEPQTEMALGRLQAIASAAPGDLASKIEDLADALREGGPLTAGFAHGG